MPYTSLLIRSLPPPLNSQSVMLSTLPTPQPPPPPALQGRPRPSPSLLAPRVSAVCVFLFTNLPGQGWCIPLTFALLPRFPFHPLLHLFCGLSGCMHSAFRFVCCTSPPLCSVRRFVVFAFFFPMRLLSPVSSLFSFCSLLLRHFLFVVLLFFQFTAHDFFLSFLATLPLYKIVRLFF